MSEPFVHLTEENFDEMTGTGLMLVDFYADWCGPCRMLTPILEELVSELSGKAKIGKIDIDKAQEIASKFQVSSIPTLVLFKDGQEVGRLVGLRDKDTIKDFVMNAA